VHLLLQLGGLAGEEGATAPLEAEGVGGGGGLGVVFRKTGGIGYAEFIFVLLEGRFEAGLGGLGLLCDFAAVVEP